MVHEESAFKSSKGGLSASAAGKEGKLPSIGSLLLGGIPMLGNLMKPDSKMAKKKVIRSHTHTVNFMWVLLLQFV